MISASSPQEWLFFELIGSKVGQPANSLGPLGPYEIPFRRGVAPELVARRRAARY